MVKEEEQVENPIEKAIRGGKEEIEYYLVDVSPDDFIAHVQALKKSYVDKGVVESAIRTLQNLL